MEFRARHMMFNMGEGGLVLIGIAMISLCFIIAPYRIYASNNTSPVDIPGIKVGDYPTCIDVNQKKNLIYVCDSGSDTISVIDGSTNTVINRILAGGNFPDAIALDPVTNRLYVGFKFSNTINEINTVTNTVIASMPCVVCLMFIYLTASVVQHNGIKFPMIRFVAIRSVAATV